MNRIAKWHALRYAPDMASFAEQLVQAIERSGESRYSISKGSGVNQSQLSRLVSGERAVSFESAEKLADYLGLEIVLRPKRRAPNNRTGKVK